MFAECVALMITLDLFRRSYYKAGNSYQPVKVDYRNLNISLSFYLRRQYAPQLWEMYRFFLLFSVSKNHTAFSEVLEQNYILYNRNFQIILVVMVMLGTSVQVFLKSIFSLVFILEDQ